MSSDSRAEIALNTVCHVEAYGKLAWYISQL